MNVVEPLVTRARKVFYGWWVVGAGTFLYFLGIGSVFYGFSAFFNPMISEFGWSRAVTSGAYSLSRLEGGVEGPIVGWLIDRFGARKLVFVGVTLTGIGFMAMASVSNLWSLYLIFGLLVSMGYNTGFYHATTTATANWFFRKRSRALSIITVGGGLGGAVIVPFLALIITTSGWRTASIVMGVLMLALGLPAAYIVRSKPEDKGLLPDGDMATGERPAPAEGAASVSGDEAASGPGADEISFTVREALKTRAFWIFVGAMTLRACILSSLVVHQIPHLVDMGISYTAASACLGTMILISIPGRLVFGWLGDIWDKRLLLLAASLLQAVAIFIFIQASTLWMAYVFVVLFGIGYGGEIPLTLAFRGQLWGRKAFATLGGIAAAFYSVGTVSAPILAGYLFDVSGTYSVAFYTFMGLITVSGFAFLAIRQPKAPLRLGGVRTAG